MKKFIILILLISVAIIWADDQQDPLWQKAVSIAEQNNNWVPGYLEVNISALDDSGNEMMTSSLMFSYELEDGEITGFYDGGKRSGNMIPENDQMVQQFLAQDMRPDQTSLFYNNENWNLAVTRSGKEDKINKKQCAEFTYTCDQPGEKGQTIPTTGSVWLDLETGVPVYQQQTLKPPVDMVEQLDNTIDYQYKNGEFYPKKLISITSVNAMGQKAKMKNTVKFKKYFRYEEDQ